MFKTKNHLYQLCVNLHSKSLTTLNNYIYTTMMVWNRKCGFYAKYKYKFVM